MDLFAGFQSEMDGQSAVMYKEEVHEAARLLIDGSLTNAGRCAALQNFCRCFRAAAVLAGGDYELRFWKQFDPLHPIFGEHGGQSAAVLANPASTVELRSCPASAAAIVGPLAMAASLERHVGSAAAHGATLDVDFAGVDKLSVWTTLIPWESTMYVAVAVGKSTPCEGWLDFSIALEVLENGEFQL